MLSQLVNFPYLHRERLLAPSSKNASCSWWHTNLKGHALIRKLRRHISDINLLHIHIFLYSWRIEASLTTIISNLSFLENIPWWTRSSAFWRPSRLFSHYAFQCKKPRGADCPKCSSPLVLESPHLYHSCMNKPLGAGYEKGTNSFTPSWRYLFLVVKPHI